VTRPPYALTDGEAWVVPGEPAAYHLTPCADVIRAYGSQMLQVAEVYDPGTLAGRALCDSCAEALGYPNGWAPPLVGQRARRPHDTDPAA